MADTPVASNKAYAQYGWETAGYGTAASTIDKAFGHDVKITPVSSSEMMNSEELGQRNLSNIEHGNFKGRVSVNFTLGNTYWLKAALGTVTDSGSAPTTHTYAEYDTLPSFTIEDGLDLGTADVVRKYAGCKVDNWQLEMKVGQKVAVTLECPYKTETKTATLDSTPATDSIAPMYYKQGTLEFPNGTTISNVQECTLKGSNKLLSVYGCGSRFLQNLVETGRTYGGNVSHTFENGTAFLQVHHGSSSGIEASPTMAASLELTFTNGLTGANTKELVIRLGSVHVSEDTVPKSPNELVVEDAAFDARFLDACTGKDNVAATP